jgi:SAM-dependent methyltransferase
MMRARRHASLALALLLAAGDAALAQGSKPFEPVVGQPGKDVVWVPTPPELVELMLDLAKVTRQDYVIDLGSGDGRNVIAAARRGARALGVEFNPDMVALSKQRAAVAGMSGRATFVQGDMFEADVSKATVLALFLLPSNMLRLRETFLSLRPGTRIVSNTFGVEGWEPDDRTALDECEQWCTALLWVVPARVAGRWSIGKDELVLDQIYQKVTGTLGGNGLSDARVRGPEITFAVGEARYGGRISGNGNAIEGTVTTSGKQSRWKAVRR